MPSKKCRNDASPVANLHVHYNELETKGRAYVEELKGTVGTLLQVPGTRIRVHVHLDGDGMSGDIMCGEPPPHPTTAQEMHFAIEHMYAQFA